MNSRHGSWGHRSVARRAVLRGGAVAGAAAFLAACGGSGSTGEQPAAKPAEQKQEEVKSILWPRTDTSAQAVKGGIFQLFTSADVTNLDPLSSPSYTANAVAAWIYPRLLQYKPGYRVPATGEVEPYLAQSWEQPEPTRLVLKLRANAVWEDRPPTSKRTIDADDVLFSWKKFATQAVARRDLVKLPDNPSAPVDSVEAIDKSTIAFKLAYPYAPLQSALAFSRYLAIMPRESDGGYDPRNETRGGGPWLLQSYQRGVKFEYRKNPNFWDKDSVYLDGYDLPIIPEYAAQLAQFRAKRIWSSVVRQEDIVKVKQDLPELALDRDAHGRTCWFVYYGYPPGSPFNDERVRQAAAMVIDRDAWIDSFYNISEFQKAGYPTDVRYHSHISAGWEGLWVDPKSAEMGPGGKHFTLNVAEAKKLMAAAGYANGIDTDFAFITTGQYGTLFPKHAEVFKGMLEASGLFRLRQINPDYQTEWIPKWIDGKGDWKGIAVTATTEFPEVDLFLSTFYHTSGSRQVVSLRGTGPGDFARSDELIAQQRQELDFRKRAQIIKEWQKHVALKMPLIPYPGQSPAFTLFWPWIGNAGVFRAWDTESGRSNIQPRFWFDKSKYTG